MNDLAGLPPQRRAALAEATIAEFARAGYEGASLNRIIRDAGMSKSSFYHFIGSREELLDAVVRMLIADVTAQWEVPSPASFTVDFWQRVDGLMDDVATLSESTALQHLGRLFYLPTEPAGARRALLADVRAWVEEVLRAGRGSGAVRDDLPLELQADAAFAVLRAIDEWALDDHGAVRVDRAAVAASAPGLLLRRLLST